MDSYQCYCADCAKTVGLINYRGFKTLAVCEICNSPTATLFVLTEVVKAYNEFQIEKAEYNIKLEIEMSWQATQLCMAC